MRFDDELISFLKPSDEVAMPIIPIEITKIATVISTIVNPPSR